MRSALTSVIDRLRVGSTEADTVTRRSFRQSAALTRELAVTQFKLKYTGSALGYLWSLFKPAAIFGINFAVFSALLHAGSRTVNFPMQLLVGIVLWSFFSDAVATSMGSIVLNAGIIRKAYFPLHILVIASSLTAMFTFLINLCLVVVVAAALRGLDLQLHTLLVIPLLIELYALILGISMILAALFVFYRDLGHIWDITSQLLFYGSSIVFPLVLIPTALHGTQINVRLLLIMNPITQIVEDVRHAIVSASPTVPWSADVAGALYIVPLAVVAGLCILGAVVFARLSARFAENL
jgi:ABC-2 type transport system permease protein